MNNNKETYKTIVSESLAEFKDRGSRFLGFVFPVKHIDEIKKHLKKSKENHPKAVHHCYAYRLGFDNNNYRAVDDGEPSGSAGKPILGQLHSAEITNVLVIVVRYWGGVLLGVPGLINAYKTATQLALQENEIIEKEIEVSYNLSFDYTVMNDVMKILKQYHCTIQQQSLQLFCDLQFSVTLKNEAIVTEKLIAIENAILKKTE